VLTLSALAICLFSICLKYHFNGYVFKLRVKLVVGLAPNASIMKKENKPEFKNLKEYQMYHEGYNAGFEEAWNKCIQLFCAGIGTVTFLAILIIYDI
jgi:hypothetical protein